MLSLFSVLRTRLQALPELGGWAIRVHTEDVDRRALPSVDILFAGASVGGPRTAAQVSPLFEVNLAHKRGEPAGEALDSAMQAVVASLHNWAPGESGGRPWEPFVLTQAAASPLADSGVVGLSLVFSTAAFLPGQP